MNEKFRKALNWVNTHKKGIAIGVTATAAIIGLMVIIKKCEEGDLDTEKIQELVDKDLLDKNAAIAAWKENGGEELSKQLLEKFKDLYEFAKEHGIAVNGMFGFAGDDEFNNEFCDFEIWKDSVMVEYFSN